MASAKHITVGSTTYDIASADGPYTGVQQWNSPAKNGTNYIYFVGRNNNYCYFKVGTTFYRTADFQTFTTITVPNTSISSITCSDDGTIMCCSYSTNLYVSRNSGSSYTTINISSYSGLTGIGIANGQILVSMGNSTQNSYIYYITSSNTVYATNQQGCIRNGIMYYYNTHYYFQAIIGSSDWYLVASKNATLQASYPFVTYQTQPTGIGLYNTTPICWYLSSNDSWSIYQINITTSAITTTKLTNWATMRIMPISSAHSFFTGDKIVIYTSYNPSNYQSQMMYSAIINLSDYQIIVGTGAVGYYNGLSSGFYFKNKFYVMPDYPGNTPLWSIDLNTANIINGIV